MNPLKPRPPTMQERLQRERRASFAPFRYVLLSLIALALLAFGARVALGAGAYTPAPQTLARAATPEQVAAEIERAGASAIVSAPAALLRSAATNAVDAAIVAALRAAIADTRTNIAETAALSDLEIAALYLSQLKRDATPLTAIAPTNTIEYLIGAGMRLDLSQGQEK